MTIPPQAITIAPARCPLCGQPNRCAMEVERETGIRQSACWCTSVQFGPALLARIPAGARDRACVCHNCATQATAP